MLTTKRGRIMRMGAAVFLTVAALLLCLLFTLRVSAEGSTDESRDVTGGLSESVTDSLSVIAANVKYDEENNPKVVFAVKATLSDGTDPFDIRMAFFDGETGYSYSESIYTVSTSDGAFHTITVGEDTHENVLYFESEAIAPERMGESVYARPYYINGDGRVLLGEVVKMGVLDYVYSRYRDKDNGLTVTEEQLTKYGLLLDFGADAQIAKDYNTERLVNSHGVRLTLENGSFSDGFSYGTYLLGDKVDIIASSDEKLGYFMSWTDADGKTVVSGRRHSIEITEESVGGVYRAVYAGYADFDDLGNVTVGTGVENALENGGYEFYLGASSELFGAEVTTDPTKEGNKVLKLFDSDTEFGSGLNVNVIGEGDFTVYELDMYLEGSEGDIPLQLQFGNYYLQFVAVETSALKVYDINKPNSSTSGYLDTYVRFNRWNNVKLIVTDKTVNDKAPRSYLFINGECVSESYNVPASALGGSVAFYGLKSTTLSAYIDNVSAYRRGFNAEEENEFAPRRVLETVQSSSNDRFQNAEILLSEGALEALKAMDAQLFSEDIYLWIANLYDPETSALYFSISGRDSYGYLPDIETVAQGYGVLSTLGLGGNTVVLNDEQKANLTAWIQTLQSNRDGYYYHPHWGVSIGNSRLSRDLGNSSSSYSASGSLAYRLFDDANYRLSGGKSGARGTTVPSTYDNNLTSRLRRSTVMAVSKVILASESDNSSMPHHLRSEENLVEHLNLQWNSTCKVKGTHERHFCTDSCVIVEDPSDSYMKIEDGELVITRGYRCTSCHVCSHSLGHSYSFGHHFTSMGAQVKSAGLGTPLVMYFRDIQENVQASLRDKAEASYIAEHGQAAWDALTAEERTAIRKAAENGIWEEEVTYGTISGLLKISGIPSTHGYEFLYAEAAINSALKCALFTVENFVSTGQAIVSIYNPFNAINGIMNNINNYGSDKEVRVRARELVRSHAEELIINTSGKLKGYLMPDGGYSYNYSGFCTHSQGQPVAIAGSREGDVNGTALALGTRSALLSCLGISVSAPFGGVDALIDGGFDLNGDGDKEDEFDLTGDGVADAFEAKCTHNMRFRYIITTKGEIEKKDTTTEKYVYTFEENTLIPNGGTVVSDGENRVLKVVDDMSGSGCSVTFNSNNVLDAERNIKMKFDMKVISSNNTTSHQIFVDSGILRIDFSYKNGVFTFANVASKGISLVDDATGKAISVGATAWFTVELVLYPTGKTVNGVTSYGSFSVTQNGKTQTATLTELAGYDKNATCFRMYSLYSAVNEVYYDNVSIFNGVKPGVHDGEYLFDTLDQKIADDTILVKSPTFAHDTVYLLDAKSVSFDAYDYNTSAVIYNFDSVQANLLLSEAKAGDRVDLILLDKSGKAITGVYLVVGEDGKLYFYAANGQILTECIPRNELYPDGSTRRITKERDMVLDADLSDWVLIKIEYHHDMASPQLDVTVKYADNAKNGYKTTTAATLTAVDVLDVGANPYEFAKLNFNASGRVYLDDMYIRNVFDGCTGEHEFIKKQTASYLKGTDSFGHKEYYYSCRNCGFRGNDIFVVHTYERVVDDAFKISSASIHSAAIYAESCSLCGERSADTFVYGLPLEDPTKYNFSGEDGDENAIPSYLSIVTGSGKTAAVMSESVGEAVNYFLRISKYRASASHSATFKYQRAKGEAIADKYIYEFDFRWIESSDMLSGNTMILVKMGAGGAVVCPASYVASPDGKSATYGGTTMRSGEWHAMKYLFTRNYRDDGWDGSVFCDGRKLYGFTVLGNDVPYVDYETRWNLTEGGVTRYNNITIDIDRLKVSASNEAGHSFTEIVSEDYLISEANCKSPAVYGKVCIWCFEMSETETFTYGELGGHKMNNVILDKHKVCDADCERAETYYKACQVCGETTGETFTVGEPLGHNDTKVIVSEATKTEAEVCYFSCSRCGRTTDPAPNGEPLCYVFNESMDLPATVTVGGFTKEPPEAGSTGLWASVLSEEVEGVVNYYLNVQKYGNTSTHNLTFQSKESGGTRYTYEFDLRWHYSARMRGNGPIIVKIKLNNTEIQSCTETITAKADGSEIYYGDVTLKSGEWHTVRYEFTRNADNTGWSFVVKIGEVTVDSGSFLGDGIPKVCYETRYGQTQQVDTDGDGVTDSTAIKNCTDISFDIDNVFIGKE